MKFKNSKSKDSGTSTSCC